MQGYCGALLGFLAAALAGCGSLESGYVRSGVGTDLFAETGDTAGLEDAYLGRLCRHADLPVVPAGGTLICAPGAIGGRGWADVVEAGMNDINQRCDGYLAWLDSRRRWANPILKQIGDTNTAVTTILTATGTALPSIGIVAAAFGLARNTFVNLNSRLLYEIDQTTIQTLVLARQTEFRRGLNRSALVSRPSAVYALRQYLRICMPFTIETEINTTVVTYERGGAAALDRRDVLIDADALAGRVPIRANFAPPPAPAIAAIAPGAITEVERASVSPSVLRGFQQTLCVTASGDFGSRASPTRRALLDFFAARYAGDDRTATGTIASTTDLTRLRDAQRVFASCDAAGLATAAEVGILSRPSRVGGPADPMAQIKNLIAGAAAAGVAIPPALSGARFTPAVAVALRSQIPLWRAALNLPGPAALDLALEERLLRQGARRLN